MDVHEKIFQVVGDQLKKYCADEIQSAKDHSFVYLDQNHFLRTVEEEYRQFIHFYAEISERLGCCITLSEDSFFVGVVELMDGFG